MIDSSLQLTVGDHVCAAYRSRAQRDSLVDRYLSEAAAQGRQAMFLDRDTAAGFYGDRPRSDPEGLVDDFVSRAAAAVADGYSGLAVVVDATGVVSTPRTRTAFARLEHLADRAIRSAGCMTGLCLYDAAELGDEAVEELGALHQQLLPDDTPFHLIAGSGGDLRLDGELDMVCVHSFGSALDAVGSTGDLPLGIDAGDLTFVDVRSLQTIEQWAAGMHRQVVLRRARPIVRRLIEISGVAHVRVEEAVS